VQPINNVQSNQSNQKSTKKVNIKLYSLHKNQENVQDDQCTRGLSGLLFAANRCQCEPPFTIMNCYLER